MNTKTRGEKINEMIEGIERTLKITLLVVWGVVTIFLAIGFFGNRLEVKNLETKIEKMEKEKKESKETTYVVVDGHRYQVLDMTY